MANFLTSSIVLWTWPVLLLLLHLPRDTFEKDCTYGARGSLTVYCVNATSDYFRTTPYRFDHLDETLKCINCSLVTIPEGVFDLSGNNLKTVDIRNSSIQIIRSKAFIGLIFMENLLLSFNPIHDIDPGAFIGIRKVKYIEMEYSVYNLRPRVFQELSSLEKLNLKNNKLTVIEPGTFDGLRGLKSLDLSNNKLESLNSFDPLINLRVLSLTNNNLKVINGDEFSQLKHLQLLDLQQNHISNFTIKIDPDNHLRTLNLARNDLSVKDIEPGTFSNLNSLEELNLSYNKLETILPKFLQGLYRLVVLDLSGNRITQLTTGSYSGLPHLRLLNLSHNHLVSLKPTGRLPLHSLDRLDLSHNLISDMDYIVLMSRFPRLSHINLLFNNLSCKAASEMEVLFEVDNMDFKVSSEGSCPNHTKTPDQILQELSDAYEDEYVENSTSAWMFALITLLVVLVAFMFYVQLFVLHKTDGVQLQQRARIVNRFFDRRGYEVQ